MNEEYIVGIAGVLILSVIVNVLFNRLVAWVKKRRELRRTANTPIVDSRQFGSDSSNIASIRPNIPDLPVRPQQNTSSLSIENMTQRSQIGITQNVGMPVICSPGIPSDPIDFPMCPIHRCCNRRGKAQTISWDCERKMWKCCKNHYFNS